MNEELDICLEWLKNKPRTKNINSRVDNIVIKQTIERELKTYVSRDAVLEAVKTLKIPYRTCKEDGTLVYLALSSKVTGFYKQLLVYRVVLLCLVAQPLPHPGIVRLSDLRKFNFLKEVINIGF